MNLIRAESKAKYLIGELQQYCDRIEIVGKIRRRKEPVSSIEVLLAPMSVRLFELMSKFTTMGYSGGLRPGNKKTMLLKDELDEILTNIWFTTLDKWSVMLFIKTGGLKSIQRIETLCKNKKWQFSVSEGTILDEDSKRLTIEKEESIFELLGIPYLKPSERE